MNNIQKLINNKIWSLYLKTYIFKKTNYPRFAMVNNLNMINSIIENHEQNIINN
jgi:hypothetical protein